MLSNLSNNNSGNATKSVVEKKKYEDIEKRIDEMQEEIDATAADVSANSQAISNLNDRVDAVEDNSTFPELNTDTINPATGDKVEVTSDLDVDGEVEANSVKTNSLSVNGTSFTTVKDDAAQAKSTAESAKDKADEAYDLADAVADELADYKADNEQSITTGTLNADSVVTDSIAAQTINTNDFETTNAEIDKLYVDTIKATGFLELPTAGQQYYTITVPAKTTASFSGIYTSDNNTDYSFYFTVSDGAVIYKQGSTEIIKDISFDRETGYTKIRLKSSTNLTYISSALDSNPVTIEDGGEAYADYAFIPQKTGGYLIRGYDDTTTEVYIAGVLRAYAMSVEEEIIERTSVDFLKVNASIELPEDWDAGGTISYSTGEENQYISAQTKAGVTKPTWTSPIHSTIGSLSYSSKLVDEATVASYKGISETRQTETISITNEASLQQLTAFHWTKNGNYWQPYEVTRITIGDHTMWIDPTESNQGIRFYNNQVIADGTWNDVPVEEANAVPVNLVIFDAPSELSFPITNLGDRTTVHGEITATCFKGNVLGNVTGNADTATNATCFDNKTYAEACTDILSGCAADSNKFNNKTYSEACADILSGNAASATNATCFDGKTYAEAKTDILSGCAANANDATCFDGKTYSDAKADILSGNAASATNATCFDGKTYAEAKADILSGCAADSNKFNNKDYATACADILAGKACTSCLADCACTVKRAQSSSSSAIPVVLTDAATAVNNGQILVDSDNKLTYTPSTDTLCTGNLEATTDVKAANVCGSTLVKGAALCSTGDLNVDGDAYITGDLTVQGTITTTHSEEVVTPSENIILRDGATTPIASGCYSGFTVTNYDGLDNDLEVGADKDGTLHVGVVGGTMEPIATRATEACMEDGYAAHWDSTGTDLVTKGATSTHDLCINGDATATGTITGTFSGNLTGNVTGNLTGNADTATDSTLFNSCTYAQAKADILSGCAADSDKFAGCTYSQAKTDILSGCVADSAKLGNKDASCYIDNSSTAQTKAGTLCIGSPSACTSTSAGGNGVINGTDGGINLYATCTPYIHFHHNKYCGAFSVRMANTKNSLAITVNDGDGCTAAETSNAFYFCSDGTFKGAKCICGTNIYQSGNKVIDSSSTTQSKAGNLCIGAPSKCTSTSAGGNGILVGSYGALQIFQNAPTVDFHYNKYCGEYSARLGNTAKGRFHINVNDGEGCTTCTENKSYFFCSDGTFTGASTICASTNIYSNGCPVVTTGTLPTVAPGYNCTGTSNYVVTTMVCCAKSVCRNQATTGTCHLALFSDKTAVANADAYVSNGCELTYAPATGVLNVRRVCQCTDSYHVQVNNPGGTNAYLTLKLSNANKQNEFSSNIDIYVYNNHINIKLFVTAGSIQIREISKTTNYGINQYLLGDYDSTDKVVTLYFTFTGYLEANIVSSTPIVMASASPIAPTGTFVDIPYPTHYVSTSSTNAEYPLVFSTCCATPAAGNRTLYNDSANNLMYNPSTNTLTACCIIGSARFTTNPTACTSTKVGASGIQICSSGAIEAYASTPIIDFHVNNACADYSHRLLANNGYVRLIATNATGCTAATQTANFDFCSDGVLTVANDIRAANTVRRGEYYNMSTTNVNKYVLLAQASYAYNGNHDITLTGSLTNDSVMLNKFALTARVSGDGTAASYVFRSLYNVGDYYKATYEYNTTTYTLTVRLYAKLTRQYQRVKIVVDNFTKGDVYPFVSTYDSALTLPMTVSDTMTGTEITTSYVNAVSSTNATCFGGCTYAQAKADILSGNAASATTAASATNSTCFGGCTYAQAKTDIAGSVETTPYTCINDVNSGAQNILMTSSTGTLGIVNASTGTNACPLTFNPATGVLTTCKVEAKSFKPTCYSWSQCITGIKLNGTTLCMCLA